VDLLRFVIGFNSRLVRLVDKDGDNKNGESERFNSRLVRLVGGFRYRNGVFYDRYQFQIGAIGRYFPTTP